jgi:hypothetical protein
MQNKHDIRNQHKKLHRTPYILAKYTFHQNLTRRVPQDKIQKNNTEGEHRSNFGGKYILLKYKVFGVVFYADSEYRVYFALEPCFDG